MYVFYIPIFNIFSKLPMKGGDEFQGDPLFMR